MTACISRMFMWHDLWDADHRPMSSANLTGSPARTGRICAESYFRLLGDEDRPYGTAGDDHHAISERPTVELESGWTSSRSSGTMLWRTTIGLEWRRSRPRQTSEAMNISMPRSLRKSLAVMFRLVIQCWWTDWTFRRIFGRAPLVKRRVLNCIPMNWKSWLGVRSNFSKLMI